MKSIHNSKRVRVLFVCLGNSCRSPMAEAIARREASDIMEPFSAGLIPLGFVAALTQSILLHNGYTAEGLASKPLDPQLWDTADLVINMSGEPKHLAFEDTAKVEDWFVEDPYGADPVVYQRILVDIETRVKDLADRLRTEQGIQNEES